MKNEVVVAGEIKLESVIDGENILDNVIDGENTLDSVVDGEGTPITEVTVNDHRILKHRDAPDQHPISAITGLKNILDTKLDENDVARVAITGNFSDLNMDKVVVIDCGTSTEVI